MNIDDIEIFKQYKTIKEDVQRGYISAMKLNGLSISIKNDFKIPIIPVGFLLYLQWIYHQPISFYSSIGKESF